LRNGKSAADENLEASESLKNDTAVYHALAFNPRTCEYDLWKGTATREAIASPAASHFASCGWKTTKESRWAIFGMTYH